MRKRAARRTVTLAASLAAVVGCYRPSIEDGGFLCNTDGKPCPDGFSCVQGRCMRGGADDGGANNCTFDVVAQLCDDPANAGEMCNPACQTGCPCGRCNVANGKSICTAVGTKMLGEKCNPTADDCGAGLICLGEMCGNHLGRCYQHCDKDQQCTGNGSLCQIPILDAQGLDSGYKVCDLATQTCDPIADTGCPDPALHCYLTSGDQTLCDCANRNQTLNQDCSLYNDCAPDMGLVCVTVSGVSRCMFACDQTAPVCAGKPCVATGAKYGYCQMSN
jgi:hypothetical protein